MAHIQYESKQKRQKESKTGQKAGDAKNGRMHIRWIVSGAMT